MSQRGLGRSGGNEPTIYISTCEEEKKNIIIMHYSALGLTVLCFNGHLSWFIRSIQDEAVLDTATVFSLCTKVTQERRPA